MPGAMRDRETGRATGEALAALVGTESRYQPPRSAGRSPHGGSVRDRLRLRGAATLTTPDLLVALLGNGSERAVEALMRRHGAEGLSQLKERDITEARFSDGAACRLAALLEFHRRLRAMQTERRPRISKPSEAYDQVHGIASARKEHLVGLYLDAQNGLLHSETISIGSLNTTRTHPREILYPAIQNLALGFILAHNHPSGNPEPSPEDVEFTRSVRRAGELMGIELYDHIIVTPGGYTSLRERGLIN
jgi:DNA repair protein RadC